MDKSQCPVCNDKLSEKDGFYYCSKCCSNKKDRIDKIYAWISCNLDNEGIMSMDKIINGTHILISLTFPTLQEALRAERDLIKEIKNKSGKFKLVEFSKSRIIQEY